MRVCTTYYNLKIKYESRIDIHSEYIMLCIQIKNNILALCIIHLNASLGYFVHSAVASISEHMAS